MRNWALALLGAAISVTTPISAHHSFAMFDERKVTVVHGALVAFTFLNPHSWISLNGAVDAKGAAERWDIEATSPMTLRHQGISAATVKPGDRLIVALHPRRDGRRGGSLIFVITPDGVAHGADPKAVGVAPGTLKFH